MNGVDTTVMENGTLENTHAVLILVSMAIFSVCLGMPGSGPKLVLIAQVLLCLSFFLREVDVEDFDLPGWLVFVGSGIGRDVILTASWSALLFLFFRRFSFYAVVLRRLALSPIGALFSGVAGFLFLGNYFESNTWGSEYYQLFEETAEFNAYCLLVLAAYSVFSATRDARNMLDEGNQNHIASQ